MTPRESSTEQGVAVTRGIDLVAPVAAPPTLRTGARLGWWRTLIGIVAAVMGVRYVVWQASLMPASVIAHVFWIGEAVALAIFLMTLVTLLDRGRRTAPGRATGTLDVFVTVCGEPLDVVERAIRTALAIRYPHRTLVLNDGRLAGAAGWEHVDRLAVQLGAIPVTRTSGHRAKSGNLNHALSLSTAEFVATIDGDHRADPDLGIRLLRWFAEPEVAFVAAAQRFDTETDVLNNRQPFFFRFLQPAKDAAGCAISCGSGVAYRRRALDDIGGFSEWNVVEDLHTSYRLHAAGWRSVYEPEAVTTGLAPQTAGEYAHQHGRWALDTMRLLFFDTPFLRRGLRPRVRWHYIHTTTAYLLAVPQTLFLFGPPLYLALRVQVAGGSSGADYLAHAVPYLGLLALFFASMVGVRGAVATFRSTVFDSAITVVAIGRALAGVRHGGVTRKAGQRRVSWHLVVQVVAAAGLVASLAVAVVDTRPGASVVAAAWAAINAVLLIGPLTALSERPRTVRRTTRTSQSAVAVLGVLGVVASVVAVGQGALPLADPLSTSPDDFTVAAPATPATPAPTAARDVVATTTGPLRSDPVPGPPTTTAPAAPPAALRARLEAPARGAYVGVASEGMQADPDSLAAWSTDHAGARPAIINWFQQWGSGENRFREDWLQAVAAQGAVPMITWEPWAKPEGEYADPEQAEFRLERIVAGDFDTYISAWATAAAEHRGPILLRFMHEMNGAWYPWSMGVQGQTAELYVAAWRHVHGLFEQAGAANVSWVWSVIGGFADPGPTYPGDEYVDWVGATVLNSAWPEFGGWIDYRTMSSEIYAQLGAFGKPIMLSEVGANGDIGGDAAAWIADMFGTIEREQPQVGAVVLFDMPYDERTDYRLVPDGGLLAAVTADGWFAPDLSLAPA